MKQARRLIVRLSTGRMLASIQRAIRNREPPVHVGLNQVRKLDQISIIAHAHGSGS